MVDGNLPLSKWQSRADVERLLAISNEDLISILTTMRQQFYFSRKASKPGEKVRELYNPKPSLRRIQKPLSDILASIPLCSAVHGWRRGHSTATNARPHIGKAAVMKIDIRDFYPSCRIERVENLFIELGTSQEVAHILTRLTTADYHVPQGFLTSPAIANLLLARTDRRMQGLAKQFNADYSRFGDDLAYSGRCPIVRMKPLAQKIIEEAGHSINEKKFADAGVRLSHQRQEICAVTVNQGLSVRKPDYQRYQRAIWNCVHNGLEAERVEGDSLLHVSRRLQGYIHYVRGINPKSANRLQYAFNQISHR